MSDLYITNRSVSYRDDLCRFLSGNGYRICRYEEGDIPTAALFGKVFLKEAAALMEQEHPAHVIVPEFSGITLQLLSLRRRFGFKLISLCDDSLDMILGNDFSRSHRLARRLVPCRLDALVVHSPAVGAWYGAECGVKCLTMPLIGDECRTRPELERLLPLSESIRPTEKPIVAFVGRFVGLKNISTLVRAFEPLKERAQLVLVGDGPEGEALRAMAPDAVFTGMLQGDSLLAWYNLIDILVLPSTQEAYGAVTGEALMAGARVVISRKAGSSDLVREGENGYVVDPMDVEALTDRIGKLLVPMESGRPIRLRENLLPYRFLTCAESLVKEINSL